MHSRALIIGIKGEVLSADEERLIKKDRPWGIILFSRNIKNILQLKILINKIRSISKNEKTLVDLFQQSKIIIIILLPLSKMMGMTKMIIISSMEAN